MTKRFTTAIVLVGAICASAATDIPVAKPISRYEKILNKSPFALATAEAPPEAPTAGFAANFYVSGIAKIGDSDVVNVRSRDQTQSFSLIANEPGPDGITLVSVQWADLVGKSKATIRKGAESAVIEFDQATVQKVLPVVAANPAPRQIALPHVNAPGASITQPQGNGVMPQPPNGVQPGPPQEGRFPTQRRIRLIPSRPGQ
jgi:hypothetical protein